MSDELPAAICNCGDHCQAPGALCMTCATELRQKNERLRREVDEARERLERHRSVEYFLAFRDVDPEDRCSRCGGSGSRVYGSTATWRGGIGGQMLTRGPCDKCWGSGEESRPWMSHREVESRFRALEAALKECLLALTHKEPPK